MDPLRQLRFVIPPLFLYSSLLVGKLLSLNFTSIETLKSDTTVALLLEMPTGSLIAMGAVLGALAFPLGWLIGAIGLSFIRAISLMASLRHPQLHEAWLRSGNWPILMNHLGAEDVRRYRLQALATFDHGNLHPGIGGWIQRRWNSFHLSLHAASALLIALVVGRALKIDLTEAWCWGTIICVAVLVFHAGVAYWETMRMFDFQIEHPTFAEASDRKKK